MAFTATGGTSSTRKRSRSRIALTCGALSLAATALTGSVASAHDAGDTPRLGIVGSGDNFYPIGGPEDDSYNGVKVFLSSPRHSDSGSRGECRSPGYEENVNGRQFGWRAGNGNWIGEEWSPGSQYRNIHGRGYRARLSRNTRDGRWLDNRTFARNWGADVTIITHSNAASGCPSSASYLLTMYEHSNDQRLANRIGGHLDAAVPGGWNHWHRTDLGELETNSTYGDAYVELQFHDNRSTQEWLYSGTWKVAWRYGAAIDIYLNYP